MVVLPAPGGWAAKMKEAPRSSPSQKTAASRGGIVPAWRISTMERASGWFQPCQPHQLSGWLTARIGTVMIARLGSGGWRSDARRSMLDSDDLRSPGRADARPYRRLIDGDDARGRRRRPPAVRDTRGGDAAAPAGLRAGARAELRHLRQRPALL